MIIMTYAEAFSYNMSWGPLPWLYVGEIFSSRTREVGVAVGGASQWLFNFMMSQVTPHAIDNIGWRMFLMFAIFNYAIIVYSWFFLKEVCSSPLTGIGPGFANTTTDFECLPGGDAGRLRGIREPQGPDRNRGKCRPGCKGDQGG